MTQKPSLYKYDKLIKLTTTINFTLMMLVNVLPTAAIPLQTNSFTYIDQPTQADPRYQNLGGYRLYQPIARRFLKSDSDGPFEGQNLNNGYQYASGNPCFFIDRDDHEASNLLAEFDLGPFQERQIATFNDGLIIDFIQGQYGFQLLRTYKRGFITSETVHTPNRKLIAIDVYEGNYLIRMRADANGNFYQRGIIANHHIQVPGPNALTIKRGADIMQPQIANDDMISLERFNIGDDIVYHTLDNGKVHALLKSQAHWLTTEQGTCPFCRASRKTFQLGQVIKDPDIISL